MENQNRNSHIQTPQTKGFPLHIRVVSNSEKENISPEVVLHSPEISGLDLNPVSNNKCFLLKLPQMDEHIINPFLAEFKKANEELENKFRAKSLQFEEFTKSNSETDSGNLLNAEEARFSLLSLNNEQKGFKISHEEENRVFADITELFVADPKTVGATSRDFSNLNVSIGSSMSSLTVASSSEIISSQRRSSDIGGNKMSGKRAFDKENKWKNTDGGLLKYTKLKKKRVKGNVLRSRRLRKKTSMRI